MAAHDVVATSGAADPRNGAILAAIPQCGDKHVLDQIDWRRGPALEFVGSHLNSTRAVNEAVFAIEMRRGDAADDQPYWNRCLCARRGSRRGVQNIVFRGVRGAAGSRQAS